MVGYAKCGLLSIIIKEWEKKLYTNKYTHLYSADIHKMFICAWNSPETSNVYGAKYIHKYMGGGGGGWR